MDDLQAIRNLLAVASTTPDDELRLLYFANARAIHSRHVAVLAGLELHIRAGEVEAVRVAKSKAAP